MVTVKQRNNYLSPFDVIQLAIIPETKQKLDMKIEKEKKEKAKKRIKKRTISVGKTWNWHKTLAEMTDSEMLAALIGRFFMGLSYVP